MLTYKLIPTADLIPYARNSRTHSDAQIAKIASSIREFGFLNPIITDGKNGIVAGHGRVLAAQKLGLKELPCVEAKHLTEAQKRAYVIADNRMALDAGWDIDLLKVEIGDLQGLNFDLALTGFDPGEIDSFLADKTEGLTDPDAVPETPVNPVTVLGDVWLLGKHRLMCGDSTVITDVERLMGGKKAQLLHADPPYGMGKEGVGVANDNLYGDSLDAFQMEWWATFRTFLDDNASAYIWGNAPELWRLWYRGGLGSAERVTIRNEIVWKKPGGFGISSAEMRGYPPQTERCLFFILGEQGFNNDADNYWEGWEPVRSWLDEQRKASGLTTAQCNDVCGKQNMTQAAFTKGGFRLILKDDYAALCAATGGKYFKREYDDLKREYDDLKREFYACRAHFDNTHENMTDVWEFGRVTGEDRHGHATPKPLAMMERVMRSSLPQNGLCVEPFGGSGSTLMGAETTGRVCYTMELNPKYCDVIVKRWQDFTGQKATLESTGRTFEDMASDRVKTLESAA
jgi:DNA modification methylase